jgi:hypothetical protein
MPPQSTTVFAGMVLPATHNGLPPELELELDDEELDELLLDEELELDDDELEELLDELDELDDELLELDELEDEELLLDELEELDELPPGIEHSFTPPATRVPAPKVASWQRKLPLMSLNVNWSARP